MKKFISSKQVAEIVGRPTPTIRRWTQKGIIPHHRLSPGVVIYDEEEVINWIEQGHQGPLVSTEAVR